MRVPIAAVSVSLAALLLAAPAQPPQNRPARPGGNQNGGGGRPQRPGPAPNPGGNRPNPGNGNRPGPAPNPGGNRPNPGSGNRPGPGSGSNRPQPGRPQPGRPNRPPQWGRPPQNRPSYAFRPTDRDWLRRFYLSSLRAINLARRPSFVAGSYFPVGDIGYLTPVPPHVYSYLPPPPPGYNMGYFDGYVVVYDPVTYFIANVIDLAQ